MTLPTALVIGPMKAGTTWIHDYLEWRGDVCLPQGVKETVFFDQNFNRGKDWYDAHFSHHNPDCHCAVIEVAPSLFHNPEAPRRVAKLLGRVPLIVTTRDPVARAWSHYLHLRRRGYTDAALREAIARHPEIVAASRYDMQLARWRAALPEAPLTVLPLEDLTADPATYAARLCAALDLPQLDPPVDLGLSNAKGLPPSFLLAKLGRHTATMLRMAGGYSVVNAAKRLGLKRVFFGTSRPNDPVLNISDEEEEFLRSVLGNV